MYKFGTKGIWHKPASENTKARNIPAVVLEHHKNGPLYLFTLEPIVKGHDNLTNRTVTTLQSDFSPLSRCCQKESTMDSYEGLLCEGCGNHFEASIMK